MGFATRKARLTCVSGLALSLLCVPAVHAQAPTPGASGPLEADWLTIPDDQLLVMQLSGNRRIIIRASDYAPEHVENIRAMALAHWWDGQVINRVQDNWVCNGGTLRKRSCRHP